MMDRPSMLGQRIFRIFPGSGTIGWIFFIPDMYVHSDRVSGVSCHWQFVMYPNRLINQELRACITGPFVLKSKRQSYICGI